MFLLYIILRPPDDWLPTYTHRGETLGWWGRLTYGWLWVDDPRLALLHDRQDQKEGRSESVKHVDRLRRRR